MRDSGYSTGGERPAWEQGAEWVDLRRHGPELMASEAGLLAYARGMVEWQSRNVPFFSILFMWAMTEGPRSSALRPRNYCSATKEFKFMIV